MAGVTKNLGFGLLGVHGEPHGIDPVLIHGKHGNGKRSHLNNVAGLRNIFIFRENKAAQGFVIAVRNLKMVLLVEVIYFVAGAEKVGVRRRSLQ